jgi:hypothetical protein
MGNWIISGLHDDPRGSSVGSGSVSQVIYLRKNVEHLRFAKRRLEEKVQDAGFQRVGTGSLSWAISSGNHQ